MEAAVKSIGIIRIGGWADTVLSNFVGPALKARFQESRVTLVLGESLRDWASALQSDDVVFADDRALYGSNMVRRALEMARLAAVLRFKRFDIGINLHAAQKYNTLLKAAGAKKVFGVARPTGPSKNFSDLSRYLSLLKDVGAEPQTLNFKLRVRQECQDNVMKRLAADEFRAQGYLAVGPGGGENTQRKFFHKRWTYFAEFLKLFCSKSGLPVILLGGPGDRDLAAALTHVNPKRIKSWIGKTTREEALAVVAESFGFVGCDSGLAHIAGSVGVPSVVLFGPTSSTQHAPPGNGKNVICLDGRVPCSPCYLDEGVFDWKCQDNACMKSISPQEVWRALSKISGMPE